MKRQLLLTAFLVAAAIVAAPLAPFAKQGNDTHRPPAPAGASVDFGVLPVGPLGPPPCVQENPVPPATGPVIGGASGPLGFTLHILPPEKTTIRTPGEVTFQIPGVVHSIAMYRVDKHTTRDEVGQFLCPGEDPADNPDFHPCLTAGPSNASAGHV